MGSSKPQLGNGSRIIRGYLLSNERENSKTKMFSRNWLRMNQTSAASLFSAIEDDDFKSFSSCVLLDLLRKQ